MKELPILFSTPMVQAILDDRKTQTRRIVKPKPDDDGLWNHTEFPMALDSKLEGWRGTVNQTGESKQYKCPYGQPGDVLWVRENWFPAAIDGKRVLIAYNINDASDSHEIIPASLEYYWKAMDKGRIIPSIHMPREAARIFLQVKSVRVERLQEISNEDALREGVNGFYSFIIKWNQINGNRASWESNPWVWVVEFERLKEYHP